MANELQSLNIAISANAEPAVAALKEVGKYANFVRVDLDYLSKSTTDVNNQLKGLQRTVSQLSATTSKRDLFGLKDSANSIEKFSNSAKTLAGTLKITGRSLVTDISQARKQLDRLIDGIKQPRKLFEVDQKSAAVVDRISTLLDKLKDDRTQRRLLIKQERDALKDKLATEERITRLYRQRASIVKTDLAVGNKTLSRALNVSARTRTREGGSTISVSADRALSSVLRRVLDSNASLRSKSADSALKQSLDRNTKAVERNNEIQSRISGIPGMFNDYGMHYLRSSYDSMATLQKMRARVSAWGLSREEQALFEMQTEQLRKSNPMMSLSDAYSMMMSASSSLGHYDPRLVGQTVQQVTKYAQMERALGYNVSDIGDIAKNYYGVAEARQVANDVQKTLETFRTVFRVTTTTAGKITVGDIETILRNMGPGAATISDEGLLRLLAYAEQIKVAGRGSAGSAGAGISTVGTNVKMLQLMAMGKPSSIHAKQMIGELGLLEDGAYITNKQGEVQLNFGANTSKKEGDASALAEAILLQRDDGENGLNQVIERVGRGQLGTFASKGFYDKELAQQDPVKFVERIVPLIEAFTATREHREEYYGDYVRGTDSSGRSLMDLTPDEFVKTLSEAQLTSAMTTFWAKTGLSQRVVTALATFSNKNFQERSEHMFATAMHQKSAEQMMAEEIENGNLMLASQKVQKALENLVQSFDSLGSIVGKVINSIADLINNLSNWVSEYQQLANMTAGWLVIKTLQASFVTMLNTYDLLNKKQNENADSANRATQAINQNTKARKAANAVPQIVDMNGDPASTAINGATQARTNRFKGLVVGFENAVTKMRALWAGFIKVVSFGINGIGIALLAIDLGTMLWDWTKQFSDFATNTENRFKEMWKSIVESKPVLDLTINTNTYRTDKQKSAISENQEKQYALQKRIDDLTQKKDDIQNGVVTASTNHEYVDLVKAINKLTEELATLRKEESGLKAQPGQDLQRFKDLYAKVQSARNTSGMNGVLASFVEATQSRDDASAKYNMAVERYGKNPMEGTEGFQVITQAKNDLDAAEMRVTQVGQVFNQIITDPKLEQALSNLQNFFANIENYGLRLEMAKYANEQDAKWLKPLGTGFFNKNGYDAETTAKVGYKQPKFGPSSLSLPINIVGSMSTPVSQKKEEKTVQNPLPKLPEMAGKKKFDRLYAESQERLQRIAEASRLDSMDSYGNFYQSYAQIREQERESLLNDLVAGKYRRKGEPTASAFTKFKINPDDKNSRQNFVREDFDLNMVDPYLGITGEQEVDRRAWLKMAESFKKDIQSATSQVVSSIKKTAYSIEDAQIALDDFNAETQKSASMRAFDRETDEMRAMYSRYKNQWSAEQKKMYDGWMAGRKDQRFQLAQKNALALTQTYHDENESKSTYGMNRQQGLTYNYERQSRLRAAEYEQAYRELEEMAKTATGSEKEQAYNQLLQLQQEYQRSSVQSQKEYLDEMYGNLEENTRNIVDEWTNLGADMNQLQTEMMEGFVEADLKWLDGDKKAWKDYFIDILKMMREMWLKQGIAELMGSFTKGITNNIKSFMGAAFNRTAGTDTTNWGGQAGNFLFSGLYRTDSASNNQKPSSVMFAQSPSAGAGYAWGPTSSVQQTPTYGVTAYNSFTPQNQFAYSSAPMATNPNGSLQLYAPAPTTSTGIGSSLATNGVGGSQSSQSISNFTAKLGETTGELGSFLGSVTNTAAALGLSEEAQQTLTTTTAGLNIVTLAQTAYQRILSLFSSQEVAQAPQEIVAMTAFTLAVQNATAALVSMAAQTQASSVASAFANGGVMTSKGPLPLNMYANGGIAKSAQVAVFGEGRQPEAYVPLPDGRSIPVTLSSDAQTATAGGNNIVISINVTNNQEGSSESSSESGNSDKTSDLKQFASTIKSMVQQEIVNQSRPGGLLYNGR